MNKLLSYSKEFIETGKVPVDELLSNSLYYPACGTDGRPLKRFNPLYSQYGICSYVFADYAVGAELLAEEQDTFRHYHVFASRELKESDLAPHGWNPEKYLGLLSQEEIGQMADSFRYEQINPAKAFGRWIVYERDVDAGDDSGPERFSLLYIGGEGAATYAALYLSRNIAPSVLAVINPGISFGGNYACFRSVLAKIVNSGTQLPKYFFSGNQETPASDCNLEDYS